MRRPNASRLEVVMRIRGAGGGVISEYIIRGEQVEVLSFFPTGAIDEKVTLALGEFIDAVEKHLQQRKNAPDTARDNPSGVTKA